ncbi:hypothetical protein BCR36DRAFT_371640 [Piromyces finnis]|uniref:Uncharacterized protein n=1 Tax=Piromyces finnis TaxID=1754191 RepID=A0A1Y1V729_9FUNG|nr:hypothetical protein BCR36DRAFT_371640 [Piromyces finnis]|eukprot:ORX47577.1 hypothetical protein BCR36DRAFT_371640 [Piromyces finnis]
MYSDITKEVINTFIKKERQNEASFVELFPSVDLNKMKKIFDSECYETNNNNNNNNNDTIVTNFFEYTGNNTSNILRTNDNANNKDDNSIDNSEININTFNMEDNLNMLEKCDNAVILIEEENKKQKELKPNHNTIRSDGNKFMEFLNRSKQNEENTIDKNSESYKKYLNNKSSKSFISYKKFEVLNSTLLPNTIDSMFSECPNEFDIYEYNSNTSTNNNYNNSINEQHVDNTKKIGKLIKKENKNSNNNKYFSNNLNENKTINNNRDVNDISLSDHDLTNPDIILSKIRKYNEEMEKIQNEIISNYRLNCKPSLNYNISNIENISKIKITEETCIDDDTEQPIEEISLKKDFWKTSNLSISMKELEKKSITNNDIDITSKPFLKVDNFVTWEE